LPLTIRNSDQKIDKEINLKIDLGIDQIENSNKAFQKRPFRDKFNFYTQLIELLNLQNY